MRQNYLRAAAGYRINQPTADGDEHIANTELLLKGEGTNGQTNNTFVDSSASSHTITRNGDTTQGSFSPFSPKGWSMYVDGTDTTQGISGPNVSDVISNSGKDSWTVEIWWKLDGLDTGTGTGEVFPIFSSKDWWGNGAGAFYLTYTHSTTLFDCQFNYNNNGSNAVINGLQSSVSFEFNRWYHLAVVKQGNTFRLYVDGQQLDTENATNLTTYGFWRTNYPVTIGRWWTIQTAYSQNLLQRHGRGYFSNARITNSAVYPDGTTFTPSTEPLTAITDCTLLTLQDNRYVDNSSLNSTITAYDGAAIKPTSPFSGDRTYPKASYFSGKFDGSNDYLDCGSNSDFAFGTGDFTVEGWFNATDLSSGAGLVYIGGNASSYAGVRVGISSNQLYFLMSTTGTSWQIQTGLIGNTISTGSWYHFAVTRNSTTVRVFLNGTQIASPSLSGSLYFGTQNRFGYSHTEYLNGYLSNLRIVKGTALYTSNFTPPTAPLTPVANTKLLTLQDNYLVDHSPSGHSITNNGGVTFEPESPFDNSTYPLSGTFYSGYFNGTSDNLTISDSADFDFGSGDFTVEGWVKPLSNNDTMYFGQWVGLAWFFGVSNGTLQFSSYSGGNYYVENSGVSASTYYNKWTHIAATREGNTLRIFVNGEKKGGDHTISHTFNNSSGNFEIGANSETSPTQYYNGYISNVRIVKGTALYTSDFTVPSEPLTAVSGTTLLTMQDATIQDNSASSHSITNNGATVTEIAPFGAKLIDRAGSIYSDGYYDYLRAGSGSVSDFVFGTGDFTVEAWVYRTGSNGHLFDLRSGSNLYSAAYGFGTGNLTTSGPSVWDAAGASYELLVSTPLTKYAWNHVAYVRKSQVLKIYVNGVEAGSASATRNLTDGGGIIMANANTVYYSANTETLDGYLSDLRVIKGTALYTSNFTPPTAPLQPITNTKLLVSGNNGGVEDSLGKRTFETDGNAQIDTTVKKFGSGAIEFDGTLDYLTATDIFDFYNDWTVEFWFNVSSLSKDHAFFIQAGPNWNWTSTGIQLAGWFDSINRLGFNYFNGSDVTELAPTVSVSANTWYYYSVVREGTRISLYLDGQRVDTTTALMGAMSGSIKFGIGSWRSVNATQPETLDGYIDDFRITTGVARYDPTQTTHTVPTKTHPTV